MILKNGVIVVTQCFLVLKADEEVVLHTWMTNLVHKAGNESCHQLQIWKERHEIAIVYKEVEVSCNIDNSENVMILYRLITLLFYLD